MRGTHAHTYIQHHVCCMCALCVAVCAVLCVLCALCWVCAGCVLGESQCGQVLRESIVEDFVFCLFCCGWSSFVAVLLYFFPAVFVLLLRHACSKGILWSCVPARGTAAQRVQRLGGCASACPCAWAPGHLEQRPLLARHPEMLHMDASGLYPETKFTLTSPQTMGQQQRRRRRRRQQEQE